MINDSEKQENKGSFFVDYYNTKNETPFLWDHHYTVSHP